MTTGSVVASAFLCGLLLGCGPPLPQGDDPLASLAVPMVDGTPFDPATLRGKTVVVNFWKPS